MNIRELLLSIVFRNATSLMHFQFIFLQSVDRALLLARAISALG